MSQRIIFSELKKGPLNLQQKRWYIFFPSTLKELIFNMKYLFVSSLNRNIDGITKP